MAIIKMRFKTPDTGEYESGVAKLQLKSLAGAPSLTQGESAIITAPREYDVPAGGTSITTMATPFGWYYHVEGTTDSGWKFHTNVYVPNNDTYDLDELVTLDPNAPFSGSRPDPQWWSALDQLTDIYEVGMVEARDRAETAADEAETWAIASESSATDAAGSATASQTAQTASEAARDDAEAHLDDLLANGIPTATETENGLMSAPDKAKLNSARSTNGAGSLVLRDSGNRFNAGMPTTQYHATPRQYVDEEVTEAKMSRLVRIEDFGPTGTSDDTDTILAFLGHLNTHGGIGVMRGEYTYTRPIATTEHSNYTVIGPAVLKFRPGSDSTGWSFVRPTGLTFENLTFDGGFSVTGFGGHGAAVSNAVGVTFLRCHFEDYMKAALGMFRSGEDPRGEFNYITDCTADGKGVSNNGFYFANQHRSYMINCVVKNTGMGDDVSPCYALQFKNECYDSHIVNGVVEGGKGGIVFASDGNDGPQFCTASGTVRGAKYSFLAGKTRNCRMIGLADMENNPDLLDAIHIGTSSVNNYFEVDVSNIPSGSRAFHTRSSGNTINLNRVHMNSGAMLGEITSNTGETNIRLGTISPRGSIESYHAMIDDQSGQSTNSVVSTQVQAEQTPRSGNAFVRMSGQPGSTFISATSSAVTFRVNGVDTFNVSRASNAVTAGPDNSMSLGRAVVRYTELFATAGTINTSDEREKQDVTTDLAPELRAWGRVEYVKYRWIDAVETKGADGARYHFGVIAQQVKDAFEAEGLDPFGYGVLCYDEWEAEPATYGDDGEELTPAIPAGNRYGIRYEEALALEAAYTRARLDALDRK